MKSQFAALAVSVFAAMASIAEVENKSLSLTMGTSKGIDLGIEPKNYQIIDKDIVNVTLVDGSTTAIIGARNVSGTCQVKFNDVAGGDGVLLKVTVISTVDEKLAALRSKYLAEFDDITCSRLGDRIVIDGTVSTPDQWTELQRVCGLSYFKDDIENIVKFRVDPTTVSDLRKAFEKNGVKLVAEGTVPGNGEVAMEYDHNVIRLYGTVFSPEELETIERILGSPTWLKVVKEPTDDPSLKIAQAVNRVKTTVNPAKFAALKEDLTKVGFRLAAEDTLPGEGEISIRQDGTDSVAVNGSVYSSEDRDKLERVLRSRSWLSVGTNENANAVAKAKLDVAVDSTLLELGVAFLKIAKTDNTDIGAGPAAIKLLGKNLEGAANATLQGFRDFVTGNHSPDAHSHFGIKASLGETLKMLDENGIARERVYGTIRFHANGDSGKKLHLGGKLTVTPPASGEGEAPESQSYDYGFKITNLNSHRISATDAEADVEIEFNGQPVSDGDFEGTSVRQETRSIHPTVRIPLGQTVAVAGYESLIEETTLPSGTPWLRKIPIVNWFVANQKEKFKDESLLFLVSIRKVDVESEAPMVENTPMKDITLEANTDNKTRIRQEKERQKSKKRSNP